MKRKHNFYNLRYDYPTSYDKEKQGNIHFWMWFHAKWYETVIIDKTHPTTKMKSINWTHLDELDMAVVNEAISACERRNLQSIMSFNCNWNEEVVTKFYATLYINREDKFHWTIQGKPFLVGYVKFATILEFSAEDHDREKIHDENVLENGEIHYMYDIAYGKV